MRHRVLIIVLLLLAGAVVNVGVTCLASRSELPDKIAPLSAEDCLDVWLRYVPEGARGITLTGERHWGECVSMSTAEAFGDYGLGTLAVHEIAIGWPFRCLRGAWVYDSPTSASIDLRGLTPTRLGWFANVPYFPVWPGLVGNTLWFAALFALPLTGCARLRRARRVRRGLCPRCKYPVGESPVCSECGTAVRMTTRRTHGVPRS